MRKSKNFLAGNSRTIPAKSIVLFKTAIYFFYAIPLIFVAYLYLNSASCTANIFHAGDPRADHHYYVCYSDAKSFFCRINKSSGK